MLDWVSLVFLENQLWVGFILVYLKFIFAVRYCANIVYIKFPDLQQLLEEAGYDLKNYVDHLRRNPVEKNLLPE